MTLPEPLEMRLDFVLCELNFARGAAVEIRQDTPTVAHLWIQYTTTGPWYQSVSIPARFVDATTTFILAWPGDDGLDFV